MIVTPISQEKADALGGDEWLVGMRQSRARHWSFHSQSSFQFAERGWS